MRAPFFGEDVAVANAKAMEASNEYAALMEARLANFQSREELEGQFLIIQQLQSKLSASQANEQHRVKEFEDLNAALAAGESDKVAIMGDFDSLKEKFKREAENREKTVQKEQMATFSFYVTYVVQTPDGRRMATFSFCNKF
ncbi:Uncharacterized protein Rs2_15796 [Raphanus sativus]|nr:Uncharacterized protein Rs2_15796 [Raphanus sativus]